MYSKIGLLMRRTGLLGTHTLLLTNLSCKQQLHVIQKSVRHFESK